MKLKKIDYKQVISTNNTAINIIKKSNINYGIVISEYQKNGRGQYGRKWISFKGNLFVSIFYNLEKINISLKTLTKINCDLVKKTISNEFNAIVTCPINKEVINAGGIPFTGHTEELARLSKSKKVVMMLANQKTKIALASTHIPLSAVLLTG